MQSSVSLREFGRYASLNILGMAGISCYILADTFFVARGTGSTGLAALNIAIPAFNLMNGIGLMIGVGGATLLTLRRAQGEPDEADRGVYPRCHPCAGARSALVAHRADGRRADLPPARLRRRYLPL